MRATLPVLEVVRVGYNVVPSVLTGIVAVVTEVAGIVVSAPVSLEGKEDGEIDEPDTGIVVVKLVGSPFPAVEITTTVDSAEVEDDGNTLGSKEEATADACEGVTIVVTVAIVVMLVGVPLISVEITTEPAEVVGTAVNDVATVLSGELGSGVGGGTSELSALPSDIVTFWTCVRVLSNELVVPPVDTNCGTTVVIVLETMLIAGLPGSDGCWVVGENEEVGRVSVNAVGGGGSAGEDVGVPDGVEGVVDCDVTQGCQPVLLEPVTVMV